MKHAIYISVDRKFFKCLLLCLKSLKKNYPDHPEVLVYWKHLTEKERGKLEQLDRVRLIEVPTGVQDTGPLIFSHRKVSVDAEIVFFRYALWSDRFDAYDKVLHLDADTLVTGSLEPLFAGEEDFVMFKQPRYSSIFKDEESPEVEALLKEDDIALTGEQGNGGIFVISRKVRTEACQSQLLELHSRYKSHVAWADQSIMNLWMLQRKLPLSDSYEYNYCLNHFDDYPASFSLSDIRILHLNAMTDRNLLREFLMWTYLRKTYSGEAQDRFVRWAHRMFNLSRRTPIRWFITRLSKLSMYGK